MALFSTSEARAFNLGGTAVLTSTSTYPDADISAAATRIKESFERICGVAFESTGSTSYTFDGDGTSRVQVPHIKVTACASGTNDGTALTAGQVTGLKVYPEGIIDLDEGGVWVPGKRNCTVVYTHGHGSVPARIKRAALIVAVYELALTGQSNTSLRGISETTDYGVFRLSVPDANSGRHYGIPEVDATLAQYNESRPVVG